MEMDISDLGDNTIRIGLNGRLDTPGVDQVETRFTASVVPDGRNAVVDMTNVEFIASMGIRMFISVARSLSAKDAGLALYAPQELVNEVFDTVSLHDIIPICGSEDEALTALRS